MAWILLFVAGLCEVVWAYSMKLSNGFSRVIPSVRLTRSGQVLAPLALSWSGLSRSMSR